METTTNSIFSSSTTNSASSSSNNNFPFSFSHASTDHHFNSSFDDIDYDHYYDVNQSEPLINGMIMIPGDDHQKHQVEYEPILVVQSPPPLPLPMMVKCKNNNNQANNEDDNNEKRVIIVNKKMSDVNNNNKRKNNNGSVSSEKKMKKHRYAFQTRSQVDILDDGYRWRKYGQKAVKNNHFPRSYYRCTHEGCNVKKQVQRLSKDEGVVVTTYEGMHSHSMHTPTDNFEHILSQMQIYTSFQ